MKKLSIEKRNRIIELLKTTDLNFIIIAKRIGCTHPVIVRINKEEKIRDYKGDK